MRRKISFTSSIPRSKRNQAIASAHKPIHKRILTHHTYMDYQPRKTKTKTKKENKQNICAFLNDESILFNRTLKGLQEFSFSKSRWLVGWLFDLEFSALLALFYELTATSVAAIVVATS